MLTQQLSQSSLAYPKRVPHRKNTRSRRTLEDYEFVSDETSLLKTSDLGAGALGRVKRVREKATGELFAMKIMNKNNIFRYSSKENLKREVSLQKNIQHPHIVKLYHYFEDQDNVYIVLELAENGSLFDYIRAKGKCSEDEAFVYFFQTALAINYLHKNNIIHRDLKPENLLTDKNGNVKVCDFGWSAETQNKRATYCGTVEYMAPEMIKNLPYDHRIDIWSLGILLYELLHGHSPYKGRTDQEKSFNIAKNIPIQFNPSISVEACDLILNLLQPVPSHRLTMDEIFRHRWMRKYEELYQINIMSYVREQEENEGERSSSEESKRESYKDSAEARSARNSEALKNRLPAGSVTSLDGSIKARKELEGQIRSYGTVSTKGSETGSGDFSYHRDSHDGLYKYKSNHAAIQTIEEERMRGSRTKQSASVDRYDNTVSRGSLRGSDTLTQLFKRNHAIQEKLHRHHAESEIGFFKKLFIKLGCFDREKELSLL